MTALEELKSSTMESIASKRQFLSDLPEKHDLDRTYLDALLDMLSDTVTLYKLTVLQVRASTSVEEIAQLWKEAHDMYSAMQTLWKAIHGLFGYEDELFLHLGRTIDRMEHVTAEHYAFHVQ
jgi:hypothetical protein